MKLGNNPLYFILLLFHCYLGFLDLDVIWSMLYAVKKGELISFSCVTGQLCWRHFQKSVSLLWLVMLLQWDNSFIWSEFWLLISFLFYHRSLLSCFCFLLSPQYVLSLYINTHCSSILKLPASYLRTSIFPQNHIQMVKFLKIYC